MKILGHTEQINFIKSNIRGKRPINSWMIAGEEGIGKATAIKNLAMDLLQTNTLEHPDLLIITKDESEEKNISIEKIREIRNFMNLTTAISDRKVIIIDDIDSLSINSANALLKILEEPKLNCFIFLITHNPNKVIKTIMSRVFLLKMNALKKEEALQILEENGLTNKSLNELYLLVSQNKIGTAIKYAENTIENIYDLLSKQFNKTYKQPELSSLCKYDYKIIFDIVFRLINLATKKKIAVSCDFHPIEQNIIEYLENKYSIFELFNNWTESLNILRNFQRSNLEYRTNLFLLLEKL